MRTFEDTGNLKLSPLHKKRSSEWAILNVTSASLQRQKKGDMFKFFLPSSGEEA